MSSKPSQTSLPTPQRSSWDQRQACSCSLLCLSCLIANQQDIVEREVLWDGFGLRPGSTETRCFKARPMPNAVSVSSGHISLTGVLSSRCAGWFVRTSRRRAAAAQGGQSQDGHRCSEGVWGGRLARGAGAPTEAASATTAGAEAARAAQAGTGAARPPPPARASRGQR